MASRDCGAPAVGGGAGAGVPGSGFAGVIPGDTGGVVVGVGVVGTGVLPAVRTFMAASNSDFSSGVSVELRAFSRNSRKRAGSTD